MSLYVKWVNQIKAQATEAWLTDNQRAAYEKILERWATSPFVCLSGASGCGKSFVARLLAQRHDYRYTHNLEEVEAGSHHVILDAAEYTRLMRPTATLLGFRRVIVICQRLPKDPMPRADICLTERDVAQFRQNLVRNGILPSFLAHTEGTDLGLILRAEAIERGANHVA